jgi:hypothetical protein
MVAARVNTSIRALSLCDDIDCPDDGAAMQHLDLSDEEAAALILGEIRPEPVREPLPPLKPYEPHEPPRAKAAKRRGSVK